MTRVPILAIAAAALLPASAQAAHSGVHIAMSCAFEADPFCNRLLAELKASGHVVDQLPDGADLEAELAAPGAVVEVKQAPWEVRVMVRHDGLLETRTYKPDELEANPAQTVAVQVVEGLRATFAVRVHEGEPVKREPPPEAPPRPAEEPAAPEAPPKAEPESKPPARSFQLMRSEAPLKSELRADLEAYFATVGLQIAMNAAVYGTAAFFIAFPSASGGYVSHDQMNGVFTIAAALAPVAMALPTSHLAFKLSRGAAGRKVSWSKAFLAGGLASTAVAWGMALLATNGYTDPGQRPIVWEAVYGPAIIMAASAFLIPAAEVLTLQYTAVCVSAAPMAIRGGGGLSLAGAF